MIGILQTEVNWSRMHLRDLAGGGDPTWLECFAPPLATRLKAILDDPEG